MVADAPGVELQSHLRKDWELPAADLAVEQVALPIHHHGRVAALVAARMLGRSAALVAAAHRAVDGVQSAQLVAAAAAAAADRVLVLHSSCKQEAGVHWEAEPHEGSASSMSMHSRG
jgi:hypothetical protein